MFTFLHQSLLICYVITGLWNPVRPDAAKKFKHPLHLSSTTLNYNPKSGTLEISSRLFTDDFEDILSRQYKLKADLSAAAKHQAMDAVVRQYMAAHLQLQAAGRPLALNYLGFENDQEAVIVYLESAPVKNPGKLQTTCSLLYDLFDDQTNIFHVTGKGTRKSSKLSYPDKQFITLL